MNQREDEQDTSSSDKTVAESLDRLKKTGQLIFVFGSNLAGRHGAGAAAHARDSWGAQPGMGDGLTGQAYAIPTKDHQIRTMSLAQIRPFVDQFKAFAVSRPALIFQVTQIGCGLAGHVASSIAPMFKGSPYNCYFDTDWQPYLEDTTGYWGHVG
jgi:hypothetical protein